MVPKFPSMLFNLAYALANALNGVFCLATIDPPLALHDWVCDVLKQEMAPYPRRSCAATQQPKEDCSRMYQAVEENRDRLEGC
jgi:hypothetical protein